MTYRWLLVAAILLRSSAQAQWLNYSPSGTPMKDGKPDLSAPTPRGVDGKPDLTGVWAHERSSVAEWKRLLGPAYEKESRSALLGMELEVVNKYGLNVFFDMKPSGDNAWAGSAFNPDDGRTYSGKMTLSGDHLTTAGCVLGGLICQSVAWTRVH